MRFVTLLLCLAGSLNAATEWIESLGGSFTTDTHKVVTGVNLRGSWVTDTDLRKLVEYPALTSLDLSLTHITDEGMAELKNLRNVTDLNLYYSEYVTDQGLAAIKDWKKLKHLNLHGTKSSDTALEHIAGIASLESLDVGSTLMTDVGLERLATLTNLKELTMGGNELGDAGLQALRQFPTLTYLDLSGRQGTDKNVWTIVMSTAGLDAVLSLHNLRELRIGCYAHERRHRRSQVRRSYRDRRASRMARTHARAVAEAPDREIFRVAAKSTTRRSKLSPPCPILMRPTFAAPPSPKKEPPPFASPGQA